MADFTSALYLGFRHDSRSLLPWSELTTGAPAALLEPPGAEEVTRRLARLTGFPQAVLLPSTLHLFWDLIGGFFAESFAIYWDDGLYPIARWGVERAAGRGAPVQAFPHHDAEALRWSLRSGRSTQRPPLVVADGFCPSCGRSAPLRDYLQAVRTHRGRILLDDTQALGILGTRPGPAAPYGLGGGGSPDHQGVAGPELLLGASLAKAFGVPTAVLAGDEATVRRFRDQSETRVHCSPPSAAAVHAAQRALTVNDRTGDRLRLRLAQVVRHFRSLLKRSGLSAVGGLFPVQRVRLGSDAEVASVHDRLRRAGIETVAQRSSCRAGSAIGFLLTARHQAREVEHAVAALAAAARHRGPGQREKEGSHESRVRAESRERRVGR